MTIILGLSAFYHDSAAALVVDGEVVAAAQEERFTRKKHDHEFPQQALDYCLREAGIDAGQIDYVAFYDKPLLKFDRLLETYVAYSPRGFASFLRAMPLWLRQKLYLPREMDRGLGHAYKKRYVFMLHHESHAASAFFPSPFEEAAILTLDGVGEWSTTTLGVGRGNHIELTHELRFPHSIGLLYSAFTYWTGFKVNSDEYKLMGLAPYGDPIYVDLILEKLIDLQDDGSFRMDMSYFNYCQGLTMTSRKFDALFGASPRRPEGPIRKLDMDVAASIQKVTEEIMLRCARRLHKQTRLRHLCLAGGVALNCVANGRLLREGPFDDIWIEPAAGDAGGALGAALFVWYQLLENARTPQPRDALRGALLGPRYEDGDIEAFLHTVRARWRRIDDDAVLCDEVADAMAQGKVVGWFQGRMEFGPRALGSRSILGDARHPEMQTIMNVKVKFRESFRPFAPAVLQEHVHDWFDTRPEQPSPYMLLVSQVHGDRMLPLPSAAVGAQGLDKLKLRRSVIPAVTHVDGSARIQTVDAERHGLYHRLIDAFQRKTACPVIVNTSFNLGWDPIVCTPRDAYITFMSSDIDVLCIGHFVLEKTAQPAWVEPDASTPRAASNDPILDGMILSPCCRADLELREARRRCTRCGTPFERRENLWSLLEPGAASSHRPRLEGDDPQSLRALIDLCRRDPQLRALDESIPYNSTVLVTGCGTGRLANFLGISCRRVLGTDDALETLQRAEAFRVAHELARVRFLQMGAEKPALRPGHFDVVIHEVRGPEDLAAIDKLAALVAPDGHLVVRSRSMPFGPVLRAFDRLGLDFVRAMPALVPGVDAAARGGLFDPARRGSALDHFLTQAGSMFSKSRARLLIAQRPRRVVETRRAEPELAGVPSASRREG